VVGEGARAKVKSAIQLRIMAPEPANATIRVDLVGEVATKPLMSVGERSVPPPKDVTKVALVWSTRGHIPPGQVTTEPDVAFPLSGQ
jgi:hypothetical protein